MTPNLSPWDASALFGRHPSVTLRDIYERFLEPARSSPRRSLSSFLEDGLIAWASQSHNWKSAAKQFYSSYDLTHRPLLWPSDIECRASAWKIDDGTNRKVSVTTLHIPSFTYSRNWNRSGLVPQNYADQAQFIMALANTDVHAFLLLVDKSASLFWVERDEAVVAAIRDAVFDLSRRIAEGDAPALDFRTISPEDENAPPAKPDDLDTLCAGWFAAREAYANASTKAKATETTLKSFADRLKTAIPPGSHHEFNGTRIHHNVRTGQLTEEKLNDAFF